MEPTWNSLSEFVSQRIYLDPDNYSTRADFLADRARINRARKAARVLIDFAGDCWAVDAASVRSSRLHFTHRGWDYIPGQYYPTEVLEAVCQAIADACVSHASAKYAEWPAINVANGQPITYSPRHHSMNCAAYIRACGGSGSELAARFFDWN